MSNPRVYVTSDTHFGHANILKFEPEHRGHYESILEHDLDLVQRWNSVVRKEDTVWHLGDVYFGKDAHRILGALNGYKRLVLGNHDAKHETVLTHYFDRMYGVAQYGGCVLTHIPVHSYQLEKRYTKNIHGHMHSKKLDDPRYVCVSVEQTDLKPVLLQHVIQHGL
jgi:calcineurin-like phosphoesterase family protein